MSSFPSSDNMFINISHLFASLRKLLLSISKQISKYDFLIYPTILTTGIKPITPAIMHPMLQKKSTKVASPEESVRSNNS